MTQYNYPLLLLFFGMANQLFSMETLDPQKYEKERAEYIKRHCLTYEETIDPAIRQRLLQKSPEHVQKIIHRLKNPLSEYDGQDFTPYTLFLHGNNDQSEKILAHALAQEINRPTTCIETPKLAMEHQYTSSNNLMRAISGILDNNQPHVLILNQIDQLGDTDKEKPKEYSNVDLTLRGVVDRVKDAKPRNILLLVIAEDKSVFSKETLNKFISHSALIPIQFPIKMRKLLLRHYFGEKAYTLKKTDFQKLAEKTKNYSIGNLQKYCTSEQYRIDLHIATQEEQEKKRTFSTQSTDGIRARALIYCYFRKCFMIMFK